MSGIQLAENFDITKNGTIVSAPVPKLNFNFPDGITPTLKTLDKNNLLAHVQLSQDGSVWMDLHRQLVGHFRTHGLRIFTSPAEPSDLPDDQLQGTEYHETFWCLATFNRAHTVVRETNIVGSTFTHKELMKLSKKCSNPLPEYDQEPLIWLRMYTFPFNHSVSKLTAFLQVMRFGHVYGPLLDTLEPNTPHKCFAYHVIHPCITPPEENDITCQLLGCSELALASPTPVQETVRIPHRPYMPSVLSFKLEHKHATVWHITS